MWSDGIWISKGMSTYTPYIRAEGVDSIGVLYVVWYAQSASPSLSCQSRLDFATTFFSKLHNILLKAYAKPFTSAWYIKGICYGNLNFS